MDFSTFTLRTNAHDIINITTQDNRPSKDETFVIMMMNDDDGFWLLNFSLFEIILKSAYYIQYVHVNYLKKTVTSTDFFLFSRYFLCKDKSYCLLSTYL